MVWRVGVEGSLCRGCGAVVGVVLVGVMSVVGGW